MAEEEKLVWITKVERVGTKYKVFYTDCEKPLTLTEDQLIEYRMMKGNSFYPKEFEEIVNSLDVGLIFDRMLNYIDYKPRTQKEVIEKMRELKVSDDLMDEIIDRLKHLSFIDDDRYAKMYVDEEFRSYMGPKVIIYNLTLKGIDKNLIDKYVLDLDEDETFEHAKKVAEKTIKSMEGYPINKQKETIYNRLLRMGYHSYMASRVLDEVEYSIPDMSRLDKDFEDISKKEKDKNKIVSKLFAKGYSYSDIKNKLDE